jgi:hypothetical protein
MIMLGVALWGIMYAYDTTYGNYYFNLLEATSVEDVGGLMTYHYNIEATNREGKTGGSFKQTYSGTIAPPATFTVSEYNSGTFVYTLTRIGDMAFANNPTATEIIIPETVTEIADLGLLANWDLKKITCLAKTPPSHNSNFLLVIGDVSNSATLYVPAGCKSKYQTANGWRAFQNIVELEPTLGDHEYVDLDLPSGKLWSTQNYGATGPREAGIYNYWSSLDVVTTNWGSCWATPTRAEIEELIYYCTWTWDASYKGYTVTGPNGKSMFLPAAGFEIMGYGQQVGTHLYYMSSTTGDETGFVFMLYGSSTDYNINTTYNPSLVMAPIRPIVKGMTNASLQESGGSDSDDKGSNFTNLEVDSLYFTRTSENSCKVAKAYKSIATCSIPTNVTYDGHSYTVTAIGDSAFVDCISLSSVKIPSSVTSIGDKAFADCNRITEVICHATEPTETFGTTFSDVTYTSATLFVPETSINAYRTSQYDWSKFQNILPISQYTDIQSARISTEMTVPTMIYDINGKRSIGNLQNLMPGIYVVRQGDKSRKMLVK